MNTCEVVEKKSVINVKGIFSKDNKYRYMLTKVWDDKKPSAVLLGINPSKATELKGDNTATNAMNYFIDQGYGSMIIINLFAYMCTYTKDLKNRDKKYDKLNDKYIIKACNRSELILVAWGYEKKYVNKKNKTKILVKGYGKKVICFEDENGKKPQHLRIIRDVWRLVDFL